MGGRYKKCGLLLISVCRALEKQSDSCRFSRDLRFHLQSIDRVVYGLPIQRIWEAHGSH